MCFYNLQLNLASLSSKYNFLCSFQKTTDNAKSPKKLKPAKTIAIYWTDAGRFIGSWVYYSKAPLVELEAQWTAEGLDWWAKSENQ